MTFLCTTKGAHEETDDFLECRTKVSTASPTVAGNPSTSQPSSISWIRTKSWFWNIQDGWLRLGRRPDDQGSK